MEEWMTAHGYHSIQEVCGAALDSLQPFEELPPRPLTTRLTGACDGCGMCFNSCLYNAIVPGETGTVRIDADRCTGCGMCAAVCPRKAMELGW